VLVITAEELDATLSYRGVLNIRAPKYFGLCAVVELKTKFALRVLLISRANMSEVVGSDMHKTSTQPKRALLRQPLALQWFEDGQLRKRSDEERQAGMGDYMRQLDRFWNFC
jgi:hypothetical protein